MNERLAVRGGRVLTPSGWSRTGVEIEGARIATGRRERRSRRVLDASGLLVVPGLIDAQINGGFGRDFTADPAAMWQVGSRLARSGVTSFLPTLVSPRASDVERALDVLAAGPPTAYAGALPVGLHCEGPMLSPHRLGVHPPARRRAPSADVIRGWSAARGVRLVTLAPELPGAAAVVRALVRRGVVVAAGHSDATYDEARRAFGRGVRAGTHLFNAMSGPHRREPGLVGAILDAPEVRAGLIVDGVHVHPAMVSLAWRSKGGAAGILLVSDGSTAAGGRGHTRGVDRNEDGVIAGSRVHLDGAVRNLVAFTGCAPADAVSAASASPAALLGLRDRGAIRRGARGDLTLLDEDLRVAATVVGGVVVFDREGRAPGAGGD